MKKLIVLAFALALPLSASADISIVDVKLNEGATTSVLPGGDVKFDIVVDRQGGGSSNDFQSFRVDILPDGLPQGACTNVNHTFGTGTSTASYILAASSTEGVYDAEVRIYREDNCVNERDVVVISDGVAVETPAPAPTPIKETIKSGGGGSVYSRLCNTHRSFGIGLCPVNYNTEHSLVYMELYDAIMAYLMAGGR